MRTKETVKNRLVGLFAGVGGIETGFTQAGFEPVFANEMDKNAVITYRENYDHTLLHADLNDVPASEFPDHDILTGGFPCQPFSIAGLKQGFNDAKGRGNVFFKIMEILKEKKTEAVLLENVKALVTHDNGNTFKVIIQALEDEGYYVRYQVLNAKTHGNIPQNRERIFIVGFRNKKVAERFVFPEEIPLTVKLEDLIDFDSKIPDKYYYLPGKQRIYDALAAGVTKKGTIYQWRVNKYVRENKSGVAPTLTAGMGGGGNNVPLILTDHGIRKLTPRECFNLMGFPADFVLPEGMGESHLYRQAGNAVVVPVAKRIAEQVRKALDSSPQ